MEVIQSKHILNILFLGIILATVIKESIGHTNKYLKEANSDVKNMRDPLRMAKLNVLWEKARKRLSEPKLNKLLSELKIQDKEELTLKKLKVSGGDKEGLKEAELRKRLNQIASKYSLDYETENEWKGYEKKIEKGVFKDKKLHKLWLKAEKAGLTQLELKTLREEFLHHQDKIDEYYALIDGATNSPNDIPILTNAVHQLDMEDMEDLEGTVKDYNENVNAIREKHRELKNSYNSLHRKATSGQDSKEFTDPKVNSLWKLAVRANFDDMELESLFTELKHYEARLQKLSYLTSELNRTSPDVVAAAAEDDLTDEDKDKIWSASKDGEGARILEERLQKQRRKAKKIHEDLEYRILARHSEL